MARILALTSRVPYPPREGHQLRTFHLLRALASVHEVHLLSCLRPDDVLDEAGPLREMLAGFETFAVPGARSRAALARTLGMSLLSSTPFVVRRYEIPAMRARVAGLVAGFDLLHIDMLPLMTYVDPVNPKPVILNAHNVEQLLLKRRIEVEPGRFARAFLRGQLPRLAAFERNACRRADALLACSQADAETLRALAPETPVHVVPNGVDLAFNRSEADLPCHPAQLVFVGQMGWFPNRDGMEWFLAEVLPRILSARPDVRLTVVGVPDGLRVPENVAANVHLAGFVDDVRPYIEDSAVYVVPLRTGSGTRLKILEAMALGKAIVTTTVGAEGIALEHGTDALFADRPEAFAHTVLDLLSKPAEIRRLGIHARELAERQYGWEAIGNAMLGHYRSALQSRRRPP
ncbi:MAG: glycosyltransferase [Proteobacteria bacterium]|nr:glycosyltransferase [Pseudomonadota bacterium]